MAGAVMQPLTEAGDMRARWRDGRAMSQMAAGFIKPNDRLSSFERLEIYNRQYWYRVKDCFFDDYPGLRFILGEPRFEGLAVAYLAQCPSESFTLRNLGGRLLEFLEANPRWIRPWGKAPLEMARLEWAHIEAFDNAERKAAGPEDLLELGPDLVLALQPHIGLLELRYPVDDLRVKVSDKVEEHNRASNAVSAPSHRHMVRRVAGLKPHQIFLAVHRVEFIVYYRRLDADEFRLLRAIGRGQAIGSALDSALASTQLEPDQLQQKIQSWFANWAQLGWLCLGNSVPHDHS